MLYVLVNSISGCALLLQIVTQTHSVQTPGKPKLQCHIISPYSTALLINKNMAIVAKIFIIALALNLVSLSLQSQFIQDDILAFPRYKVVVTREKVFNTDVSVKHAEVRKKHYF